ncbi:292c0e94-a560-453e-8d2e-78bc4c922b20 [Sclerotinia trifoliorum]|uniref:292c0e94-a560-453e-8d2e-78bc4c922b20 n=1 Tax=Sclerotinia trifoliorum TaxID=28548 RepID=A0A8H2W3G9_9HELO|nr:292c0e94-a560-453e-8d2e-78bc4c922b20 [Sclerotinia trifoliorum]
MANARPQSKTTVKARLPPSFIVTTQDKSWTATPKNWLYGSWHMTHTSQQYYWERTKNFVIQYAPVMNGIWPCTNQELVSLTPIKQPERIYTAFGIDSPIAGLDDAWLCQCTGHLSHISDHVAFLAWGTDLQLVDWVVLYSAPLPGATAGLPAQVAIMSRAHSGPDETTVGAIKEALFNLGDDELIKLVGNMRPLLQEDLEGGRPTCEYHVVQNVDSLTRF